MKYLNIDTPFITMLRKIIPIIITSMLVLPVIAEDIKELPSGFEGVSWNKVVPIKKATFVKFDENSLVDDFAYMAAIPASVFYDEDTGRIYSYPLLFYDEYVKGKEEMLSLNARQGLDYFMEDWIKYAGKLKEIDYINVDTKPWKADNYTVIKSSNIYEIASKIALHDWSYSNKAVVAVVGDVLYGSYNRTEKQIQGKISPKEIKEITLTGIKQDSIAPQYSDFYVPPDYKFIRADLYWPSVSWMPNIMFLATLGLLQGGLTIPAADPDLQLYCYYENELMEVASSENWNILVGPYEELETYVYNAGKWKAAIVDIPTKGILGERHGTVGQRIKDMLTGRVTYYIDLKLYPGEEIELPDIPPFMARNVDFELSWKGDGKLGLIIVDENNVAVGEAVATNVTKQKLHLDQLGEGKYKAVVIQLSQANSTISYTLKYSWECKLPRKQANYLMNAAEGAVLASLHNAPLLYVKPDEVPDCSKEAMKKLGVRSIYFIDIGGNSSVKDEVESIAGIKKEFHALIDLYKEIRNTTNENDIVFTTIDPWTYWLIEKLKPEGEKNAALYVAPAAYMAAHHGCPLIAVDMHSQLSKAVVWHNEWWKRHAIRDEEPNIAAMYLTGREVYDFLDKAGLDMPSKEESIITVAGQFDIGTPWDRMFVGVAYSGRIMGTPVDTSYWICRSIFYPAIIFANPALSKQGITLINGSKSVRMPSGMLKIIKPSQEEHFYYPVLNSWITYCHRFNERASKYWGFNYTCASGITPYYEPSNHPIDNNVLAKYGKYGSYWPDLTESEIVPFYLKKAGYDVAHTTNFTATMENLNRGVIMWLECTHGWHGGSGSLSFWNPYGMPGFFGINISLPTIEPNPWRGYEIYLPGYLDGSTEEPDVLSQSKLLGIDIVPAKLSEIPIIKNTRIGRIAGYDGNIITVLFGRLRTKDYNGYDMDKALGNIHSCGFNAGSCLISNTYLHLTLVRHGSVFQVIDPWETSWYSAFAMEMFARDIALGKTVGEAFTYGIMQTGIGYLTKQWWWDIKENVCYFGDPDLKVYTPLHSWEEPTAMESYEIIGGHTPYGATEYPHEIKEKGFGLYVIAFLVALVAVGAIYMKKKFKEV